MFLWTEAILTSTHNMFLLRTDAILTSTNNICFYGELESYPSIITRHPPYLFYCWSHWMFLGEFVILGECKGFMPTKSGSWRGDHGKLSHRKTAGGAKPGRTVGCVSDLGHVMKKSVFRVFDQVRLKPACAATEASLRLEISDIETRDVQADLRLCCSHIWHKQASHEVAHL